MASLIIDQMIFLLETGLNALEEAAADSVERMYSQLLDADRNGRHILILSRELCDWGIENLDLSGVDRNHLISVRQRIATTAGIATQAKTIVKVAIGNHNIAYDPVTGNYSLGHMQLIAGQYLLTKTALVLEDLIDDRDLFDLLMREAEKLSTVPGFVYDPIHGGGSRTIDVFEAEIAKNKICVCIVDNDRFAPCDAKSQMATRVLGKNTRDLEGLGGQPFVGMGFTTIGRELENQVPFGVLREVDQYRAHSSNDTLAEVVVQTGIPDQLDCAWLFFDVKEGLDGNVILEKAENGLVSQATVEWLCQKFGTTEAEFRELRVHGYGNRVVRNFLNCPTALAAFHRFTRTDYWRSVFLDQLDHLLWFFASLKVNRV